VTASLINPYLSAFSRGLPSHARKELAFAFSWAVPTEEAVRELAARSPLLEIGAGTGYWAWLLRQAGADVLALDRNAGAPPRWSEVSEGEAPAAAAHPERTLLLCWPPLGEPMAFDALRAYRGRLCAYVGERGKTGDDAFHELLAREFRLVRRVELPRWPGCADSLEIHARAVASGPAEG
jgi:hypothetical protein